MNLADLQYVLNSISPKGYQVAFNRIASFFARLRLVAGKGANIEVKYHYAGNSGGGSFAEEGELNSGKQSYRTIHLPWKQIYKKVVVTGLAQAVSENGGVKDISDLMKSEATNAVKDLFKEINTQLLSDGTGNGGNDIQGIKYHLADSGTYGTEALDRATYGWLAALVHDNGGTLRSLTKALIDAIHNALMDVRGANYSEVWASSTMVNAYENLLGDKARYIDVQRGDITFKALSIHDRPVIGIPGYPVNRMDFVLADDYEVQYLPQKSVDSLGREIPKGLIKVKPLSTTKDTDEVALIAYVNLVCKNVFLAGSLQDVE